MPEDTKPAAAAPATIPKAGQPAKAPTPAEPAAEKQPEQTPASPDLKRLDEMLRGHMVRKDAVDTAVKRVVDEASKAAKNFHGEVAVHLNEYPGNLRDDIAVALRKMGVKADFDAGTLTVSWAVIGGDAQPKPLVQPRADTPEIEDVAEVVDPNAVHPSGIAGL